ncbi:MAG: helix-turn-helix domain-containing protein [Firmicutes bacterium]|nr:helix-turn-helix domain-containing protein [Bacillota bacterium]
MDLKIFSERLKELRAEKGLSMKTLGKAIGASSASVYDWENCNNMPSADAIYKLAKFFGVSADFLIGLED